MYKGDFNIDMLTTYSILPSDSQNASHNSSASLFQWRAVSASSFVACLYTVYVGVRMLVFLWSIMKRSDVFVSPCQRNSTASSWRTKHTLWAQSIAKTFLYFATYHDGDCYGNNLRNHQFFFFFVCCSKRFELRILDWLLKTLLLYFTFWQEVIAWAVWALMTLNMAQLQS